MASGTKIPLNTVLVSSGGPTLSNNGIKIAEDGIYLVTGIISGQFADNQGWACTNKNSYSNGTILSSAINRGTTASAVYKSIVTGTALCQLSADDTVYLYTRDSVGNLNAGMDAGTRATELTVVRVA